MRQLLRQRRIRSNLNSSCSRMIGLLPYRALRTPVSSIATTDPIPRQSRSKPRTPSSTANRCYAKGTSGAHAAIPKPATKNPRRVASRVAGRSAEGILRGTPKRRDWRARGSNLSLGATSIQARSPASPRRDEPHGRLYVMFVHGSSNIARGARRRLGQRSHSLSLPISSGPACAAATTAGNQSGLGPNWAVNQANPRM